MNQLILCHKLHWSSQEILSCYHCWAELFFPLHPQYLHSAISHLQTNLMPCLYMHVPYYPPKMSSLFLLQCHPPVLQYTEVYPDIVYHSIWIHMFDCTVFPCWGDCRLLEHMGLHHY